MKYSAILILLAACLCCCTGTQPDEPSRPGNADVPPGETPPAMPAIVFSPENTTEYAADDSGGPIHIILYREAEWNTPSCECELSVGEGADFARTDRTVVFGKGASTAVAALYYSTAKMGADKRRVTITIAGSGASITIYITRTPPAWTERGTRLLFRGDTFIEVSAWSRRDGATTQWRLEGTDTERRFTVSDAGEVLPLTAGGVTAAANYGHGELWPCVLTPSAAGDGVTALNVCDCSETSLAFPHTEYIFTPPTGGTRISTAEICDGWLLPVVAIDGLLLEPADNCWTAPAVIEADGTVTVFGPYHNSSPLFRVNAAPLLSTWEIRTDGTAATIAECFSGFANTAIFDFAFRISGAGTVTQSGSATVITFATPMHNCRPDGSMSATADRTWGRVYAATLTIKH